MSVMGNVTTLPVGPAPSLDLDFLAQRFSVNGREQNYADLISHTRASSATYFDRGGVMRLAAANQPRFDYDPVTGECRGLLVEESRTNKLLYSEALNNSKWSQGGMVISGGESACDGTLTAFRLSPTVAQPQFYQIFSPGASEHTFSIRVKSAGAVGCYLQLQGAASTSECVRVCFNLATGAASAVSVMGGAQIFSGGAVSVRSLPNGWWLFSLTATCPTSESVRAVIGPSGSGSSATSVTAGQCLLLAAPQVETGVFPSSYIPTSGTAATRAADIVVTSSTSWLNPDQGTMYAEFVTLATATFPSPYTLTSDFFPFISIGSMAVQVNGRGSGGDLSRPLAAYWNAVLRHIIGYSAMGASCALSGSSVTSSSRAQISKPTGLLIGKGGSSFLNGYVRHLVFFPSQLTNTPLQELTR